MSRERSVVIDDNMAIIGSYNMDMKSVYQDTELMLAVNSEKLCSQLINVIQKADSYGYYKGKD